jgi:hypothetical protein
MKFCYVDESGTGDEPYAVMVGVIVDAQRMRLTKVEWDFMLDGLRAVAGRPMKELHTRDFYSGNGPWRNLTGPVRAQMVGAVFDWLAARKHQIVFSSVTKTAFFAKVSTDTHLSSTKTIWRSLGLHLALAIQKNFQTQSNNKGNTVLVFDNEEREELRFTDLILDPPEWTDTYYRRGKKQERLDQLVDAPYFADSMHVPMLQVADFVAYFLRRYCELENGDAERFQGERQQVNSWAQKALGRSIAMSAMFPKNGRCPCANSFFDVAPACLRDRP